jgi:polysaccharide export outer membrane protein
MIQEKSFETFRIPLIVILLIVSVMNSCTAPKDYVYLNDIVNARDSLLGPIRPFKEPLIVPDDQLSIQVSAYNPDDVQMFGNLLGSALAGNTGTGGMGSTAQVPPTLGYLVDKKGMITLPYIGEFLAAGLTIREMELFLGKQLERFVKQPVVKVRYLNHYVNVLGDVGGPQQVSMNTERITLFDVLARTGDLRQTAIRNNILVVREDNGFRTTGRIDIRSKSVYDNPYFYMQNRDMVYVEPVKAAYASRTDRLSYYLGTIGTLLSLTLSFIALSK